MPVGDRYYNHMPHVKFAYNGRRPVSLNSHIFELKQAANAAANKAAANKAAANKAKALEKKIRNEMIERHERMRENRYNRELKRRTERMENYIKRLPKNHIGKKFSKQDLNYQIHRLSKESNGFNIFKRIIDRGPRWVGPESRLPNGTWTTNRAKWEKAVFGAANKAKALKNKATANKAKALKKKNTPKPKNFKLSESLKKEAKKYRVKLMRQTWNSNKKNIVYVPKTRTQIQNEIKKMKKVNKMKSLRGLMRR